jgi:hypothetical protein
MKKTLITAVALAACAGTQLFAQAFKEGVITFALTAQEQVSVSNSKSQANQGLWSTLPLYYKTQSVKVANLQVLQAISYVLHWPKASAYSSKSQLVLVQGELSGFFAIGETLADEYPFDPLIDNYYPTSFASTIDDIYPKVATGRHLRDVPAGYATEGSWPVGHHQPWGQIFVKDPAAYPASDPICENVTFFFGITVWECYDCFFLNSFISDAQFKFTTPPQNGPPCCSTPADLNGTGKDKYYMTLSFDNTKENPYLSSGSEAWIGRGQNTDPNASDWNPYAGVVASDSHNAVPADGITPDIFPFIDLIRSGIGTPQPYILRFTLNGILTYPWSLKLLNPTDVAPDFIGTAAASYPCTGYGFRALFCGLYSGNVSIAEHLVKPSSKGTLNCCLDLPWFDWWYGTGWNYWWQEPWYDFRTDSEYPDGFVTPINTAVDLSLHLSYEEGYWVGKTWDWNYYYDDRLDTQVDGDYSNTFIPTTWHYGPNTSGDKKK